MKKIFIVVGARPNFIKITQFPKVLQRIGVFDWKIVHTGQHYDDKMSGVFFDQFRIKPDIFLGVESETPNTQMANIMTGLEKHFNEYNPDLVITVGDVNSTAAAALTANKMSIKVAHVESGLRSFDKTMPEEFNRIIADSIADVCFVTEQSGIINLLREGKNKKDIFFVGNTMIDTIVAFQNDIDSSDILMRLNVEEKKFILMTMHRPATVDTNAGLLNLIELIHRICKQYKIIFPIHPRTVKNLIRYDLYTTLTLNKNLLLVDPLDYFSFQKLIKYCKFIITDSGGIQEESTFLKIPCLTLRENTERPSTVNIGTNELIPFDISIIQNRITAIENGTYKNGNIPPLWDGKSTERIVDILAKVLAP